MQVLKLIYNLLITYILYCTGDWFSHWTRTFKSYEMNHKFTHPLRSFVSPIVTLSIIICSHYSPVCYSNYETSLSQEQGSLLLSQCCVDPYYKIMSLQTDTTLVQKCLSTPTNFKMGQGHFEGFGSSLQQFQVRVVGLPHKHYFHLVLVAELPLWVCMGV